MESSLIVDDNPSSKTKISTVPIKSVFVFLIATVFSAVILEFLPNTTHSLFPPKLSNDTSNLQLLRPKYAIYGLSKTEEHLDHVISVLERLGYDRTDLDKDWDLLWAHDYPYLTMNLKNLQPNQRINHFPGCGFITNKVDLSTSRLPFLPKAFKLPGEKNEFLKYISENPQTLFVQKHNEHRFIEIKQPQEIDLDSNNTFVQEFIQNPFLVDGYKFDIGVYVLVTSIDPLRVYIYTGDVLFRYCPVKYHPFDPKNVDKYVVGDDYLPTWEVPSLTKYYNKFQANMRGAFDAYVRDQGKNPLGVWEQVEDIIRRTVQAKEKNIADILKNYKTRNFFELMRFDLIIDENLKVVLMEANMSPNLSSAHFKQNSLLYEQILYSVLNLVGIGTPIDHSLMALGSEDVEEMISNDRNIATLLNLCADYDCDKSCNKLECELCLPCLSGKDHQTLHAAFREHLHRVNMKRIIPKPINDFRKFDIEKETQNLSTKNQWMTRWFYAKCSDEITWCF
ncbi:probable tubulin polyglutamylase ttll-15 [Episyrphus balteatus]|uniref:probable tubulin polyglutamylase ttll-15 n=1 Tax=Episyrphus balteatus TaxID=286459 RepID=UPI0024862886|nr:probable tubulin polyglutamylase ttll-15 [Episyrphus balteatus]